MTGEENEQVIEYVTATVGGQLFGLPISRVQDVFMPDRLARVPLAPPEVAGLLNLRGRIVTAIDMRRRLGLEAFAEGAPRMAVGIECKGESYGLLIDAIGEVLKLPVEQPRGQPGQSRCRARARCRAACIGSTAGCWSFSMSTVCWISAYVPRRLERRSERLKDASGQPQSESEGVMKICLVVDDFERHPEGGATNSGRSRIRDRRSRGRRAGA